MPDPPHVPVTGKGLPQQSIPGRVWAFGRTHAAVLGVIGLVALLGAVWSISQARSVPIAVAAPTPVQPSAAPTPATTPSPSPEPLRVHVLGAVHSPGVVRLPPGSRVEDAIVAAGGLTDAARPGDLNLAAPIVDGAQVVVGTSAAPGGEVRGAVTDTASVGGTSDSGGSAANRLDLNRATVAELDALPGVGPVTAQAIVSWREHHQRFSRVEELLEIDGIGPKTFQRLEPLVRV